MKHEEASLQTRKALSAALKAQMEHKPLRKITVNDLIGMCDLNRKTFYYHFTDIYDLLKWTLEQEAVEVVKQFDLLTNYHDALLFVMNYVEENAHILSCAYDSMGRDELKRFFCSDFYELADGMIDRCCANCGVTIPPDYHRSGRLRSGWQRPDGHFPHGIRRLLHRRGSVRAGKHPQRRNDLSPLSALLWQNHRCFTPPKSRKSFFLAAKSPSASCYGNRGALFALFVLVEHQALTQLLAGVLDSSLSGCQNYRAFGFTIIRHLQFFSLLYFISAMIFSKFSSCK